jgi:Flagellar biosynthesis protein, FliO
MLPDLQPYYGAMLIAVATLGALILAILVYKLFNHRVRGRRGQRLGISEFHELDKTRRLVLVRRDGYEHLLLIGGHQDLVIESRIESSLLVKSPQSQAQLNEPIALRPSPRPAVFGDRRPPLRPVPPTFQNESDDDQAS